MKANSKITTLHLDSWLYRCYLQLFVVAYTSLLLPVVPLIVWICVGFTPGWLGVLIWEHDHLPSQLADKVEGLLFSWCHETVSYYRSHKVRVEFTGMRNWIPAGTRIYRP